MSEQDLRRHQGDFTWEGTPVLAYKQVGAAPFRDVTRQVLFDDPTIAAQLRYFEVSPGGYSTLERHQHAHAVLILRGRGRVLLGDTMLDLDKPVKMVFDGHTLFEGVVPRTAATIALATGRPEELAPTPAAPRSQA